MLTYVYSIKHHSKQHHRRLWEHGFDTYEKVLTGVVEFDDRYTRVHLFDAINSENQINLWTKAESVEEVIRTGKNFIYPTYSKGPPWDAARNIEWVIETFSDEMIEAINLGQCNLIVDDSYEGHQWTSMDVYEFRLLLSQYNIDITKVIVLTASWSYIYNDFPFRMIYYPYAEHHRQINSEDILPPRKPDAKKFLCLNAHHRQHRFELVYQVFKRGMENNFNISYLASMDDGEDVIEIWRGLAQNIDDPYPFGEWDEDRQRFLKLTPIFYDYTKDEIDHEGNTNLVVDRRISDNRRAAIGRDQILRRRVVMGNPVFHRENNWIYVITETMFGTETMFVDCIGKDNNHRDVSEKTWKPIGLKMPFILLHQPFALRRLRDIGYRTFHTIWDENYDEITNVADRFNTIMDLIESLNNREDFLDIMHKCEEIVEHNFQMLKLRRPEMSMIKECSTFLKDD
jgi:hypothetical protein